MSNLLKEAIVDAKALKEAALKNAESVIIEKYSAEVKNTLDKLLEQDDLDLTMGGDVGAPEEAEADPLGGDDLGALEDPADPAGATAPEEVVSDEDVPLAALDGVDISDKSADGEPVEFDLNLNTLREAVDALQNTLNEDQEFEFDPSDLAEALSDDDLYEGALDTSGETAGEEAAEQEKSADDSAKTLDDDDPNPMEESKDKDGDGKVVPDWADEDDVPKWADQDDDDPEVGDALEEDLDGLVDAIAERLTVDMGASLSGWAGRSSESQKWEMEKEMAHRRSTDVEDEIKTLKKAYEELVFENKQLSMQNKQYKQATNELKEGLQDVNLSNARLLYTNRVLRNTSLNERQKERIVEAISNAGSVMEARTIFDTLQSTVESKPKHRPQSLSEAITRRSSVIRASRHEKPSSDPFQDRMKRLAGIKTK